MTISRFSLDVGQMACGRDGEYVRLADHLAVVQQAREALREIISRVALVSPYYEQARAALDALEATQ